MAFTVYTETVSGMRSRGYERATEEEALKVFDRVIFQAKQWKEFVLDVVLLEDGKEVKREHIINA